MWRKRISRFIGGVMLTSTIIPLVAFIVNSTYRGISFNNISVSITALILFPLYEKNKTDVTLKYGYELEKAKSELEHAKNETLMAQIQPHFINNSLMALRSRCFEYPEIYESLTNFSRYLRSNFDALGDVSLLRFDQEMKNIEAYLALE